MSKSQSRTDDLADLFVSVTGDEEVTEEQTDDGSDRELRDESSVDGAVADGLEDAIAGAEPDSGDPGEAGG